MATVAQVFEPKGFDLFTTNQPTLLLENGTTIPISGYNFTATGQVMYRRFSAVAYLSGNVTLRIRWYSQTGATTGNVRWDGAIAAITPGDAQSVLTKALATATNTTTSVGGTGRMINTTDVTISNLDSLAADDEVWLAITLGAATMTLGAVLISAEVIYASTAGVGAGNVSNAGGSTDNAIVRWDLGTGQVVQDSVVTVADTTGTMTLPAGAGGKFIGGGAADVQELAADSAAITTTLTTVLTWALPGAGTYKIEAFLIGTLSSTTGNAVNVNLAYSGTTTRAAYLVNIPQNTAGTTQAALTSIAINTTKSATVTVTTIGDPIGISVSASITVSTAGNLTLQVSRSTSGSITIKAGSAGTSIQK